MRSFFQPLLTGLVALVSAQALASSTSLSMDMGAAWNCKIVSGTWHELVEPTVAIQVSSSTGKVVCPIISSHDKSLTSNATSWRLNGVWARVGTYGSGNSCSLISRDAKGALIGTRTVTAANSSSDQSLRFDDIPYLADGSSDAFYTLECTLSKNSVLHGYKMSIKKDS